MSDFLDVISKIVRGEEITVEEENTLYKEEQKLQHITSGFQKMHNSIEKSLM